MRHAAIVGAVAAVVGLFPVSALWALVYGFPIPFAGFERGLDAAMWSWLAVLMYVMLWPSGVAVLAGLGAGLGALASRLWKVATANSQNPAWQDTMVGLLAGLGVAAIVGGLLANLDHLVLYLDRWR